MTEKKKIGVVLFQLGGPDSPEAIEPFLYNLFCDPDILDLPLGWLARRPLAKWISMRRSKKVATAYAEIGGKSPIRYLTERQALALERALSPQVNARVTVAMRYWHPFTADAAAILERDPPEAIVLLPLYPQYSRATTGSSLKEWQRRWRRSDIPTHTVERFYDHPLFLDAVVEKINLSLTHFARPEQAHLVFSAHGLPLSFVERGDPYARQVEETVRLVMARGGWANGHVVCYQSKVGRQKWLEPSLDDTVENLGESGVKHVLVVPISFVSEHIETLHEINIETREEAEESGIEQFEVMPALNDSPLFVAALTDLVLRAVGMERPAGSVIR